MSFRHPVNNVVVNNPFGANAEYYKRYNYLGHNGIDYIASTGTEVYAADDGKVAFEGVGDKHTWMGSPAGICVLLNNGGSYSGYAHLSRTVVDKGQKVSKGQLIGYVGSTGAAEGPHLHFEMLPLNPNFKNGFAGRINPQPYIETVKLATDDQVRQAYREILEREADPEGLATYRQYPIGFVRDDLARSPEKKQLEANKAAAALAEAQRQAEEARKVSERKAAEEAAKKAQEELDRIAAEQKAAEDAAKTKAEQYDALVKENNTILKNLWGAIKLIAARFGINL